MLYTDLKQGNLENILLKEKFSNTEISFIKRDSSYYDRYILVKEDNNIGFIKIWHQYFNDPYLNIELEECDLIGFKGEEIPADKYIDVLDAIFKLPQLVRCTEKDYSKFRMRGFKNIPDKRQRSEESSSTLINILRKIDEPIQYPKNMDKVRLMKQEDIPIIEDMFFKEYPARFRAVKLMYDYDHNSCFVYDNSSIKGVIFAEELVNHIHIHQIFVKKEYAGFGIYRTLLSYILHHAKKKNKSRIESTIRGNLIKFYGRLGVLIDKSKLKNYYLIRYDLI